MILGRALAMLQALRYRLATFGRSVDEFGPNGVARGGLQIRDRSSLLPTVAPRRVDTCLRVTSSGDIETLPEFLERYPPRPYRCRDSDATDYPTPELEPVTIADGLFHLNQVPQQASRGAPRQSHRNDGQNCHLWVVDERGRPCIPQAPLPRLGPRKLRHTNLTAGGEASIGGEIWFGELPLVYLSGSSGRYPPREEAHLKDAEQLFRAVGFDVQSLGWDQETDTPQRVWVQP